MTTRRRHGIKRFLGRLVPAALAGAVVTMLFAPSSQAIVLQTSYVSLRGEGAWSVARELVPWQDQLATAKSSIDLSYASRGSYFGRTDFLAGGSDFAISGVPFSAAQLAAAKMKASDLIDVPIDVATLAIFVEPPPNGFSGITQICDPDDPSTWAAVGVTDEDGCVVRQQLSDPIGIPNRNLAAMLMGVASIPGDPTVGEWNDPSILQALGVGQLDVGIDNAAQPGIAGRSDPDEINYYLQQFVQTTQPAVWSAVKSIYSNAVWDPISEYIPVPAGVTRDGAEQQLDQLSGAGGGVGNTSSIQGGLAPAPPSTLESFRSTYPGIALGASGHLTIGAMQNANGDWVAPTPASIDAAVDAGGDTPLYALTHRVAGAYPLVWVDHLYARAHGLSIQQTEGLAMLIRYLATTGQETTADVGEGQLSPALRAQALHAADQLVMSDCQGSDREVVVSSDPGPLAPASAQAMQSIGTMAHCVPAPGAPTTTTISSTTTTFPVSPLPSPGSGSTASGETVGSDSSGAGLTGSDIAGSGGAISSVGGSSGTPGSTGTVSAPGVARARAGPAPLATLLTASKLPLPAPTGTPGGDRLATFLLGAALYLIARKPVGRMIHKIAP